MGNYSPTSLSPLLVPHKLMSLMASVLLVSASIAIADPQREHSGGMGKGHQHAAQSKTLPEQIDDLRRQVSELEVKVKVAGVDPAAMKANGDERRLNMSMGRPNNAPPHAGLPPLPAQAPQMGMMAGMMGMMNSMMGGMGGGMAGGAPMGQMGGMGPSTFLSTLPGFPGTSHLYHIGSTNFFLDHPQHITLSLEQQSRLGEIRTKALLRRSDFNRRIQEAEEQLWLLTASDQPNFMNIEAKIRESEKLQGDSRLAFIQDVGEAAKVLSDEQRGALLGQFAEITPEALASPQAMGGM